MSYPRQAGIPGVYSSVKNGQVSRDGPYSPVFDSSCSEPVPIVKRRLGTFRKRSIPSLKLLPRCRVPMTALVPRQRGPK